MSGVSWLDPSEAAEYERQALASRDTDPAWTHDSAPPCRWCGCPSTGTETALSHSLSLPLCCDCIDGLVKAFTETPA